MRRVLGRLIWSQSRDIRVLNYPNVMVYEIYTNNGYLKIGQEKGTNQLYKVDELPLCSFSSEKGKYEPNKDEAFLLSTLK